jgi:flavin-dependent dehydrogenase
MLSGYTAAHFIERAVKKNSFKKEMFTAYDREIHKRLRTEERMYRWMHKVPTSVFTAGINLMLSNRLFQNWISNKAMPHWLKTAHTTPIAVNMD